MFSKLFRRENPDSLLPIRHESNGNPFTIVKKTIRLIRHHRESSEKMRRTDLSELFRFFNSARSLQRCVATIETMVAQRRVYDSYNLIVGLHKEAKSGLSICNHTTLSVAKANGLPVGSIFQVSSQFGEDTYKPPYEQDIFKATFEDALPEYIFIGQQLQRRSHHQDDGMRHDVHLLAFTRSFMELLVVSSRLINQYEDSRVIDISLVKKLIENIEPLRFLLNSELTIQKIIQAEKEREERIKAIALNQCVLFSNPPLPLEKVSAIPAVEEVPEVEEKEETQAEIVLQFISKLEAQGHHRRNIFLAIAAYDYFAATEKPKCKEVWQWMHDNLTERPFGSTLLGHSVEIAFSCGAIAHKGLLADIDKSSEIQESSFKTNYFSKIKPIALEIKIFLQKNNMRNIPSIP